MQIPDSQWSAHLEAGRRKIGLKQGLVKCYGLFPQTTHMPLTVFMMADIITATTFVQTQREAVEVLSSIEDDLIAGAYSYPPPLLLAIVRTNTLRGQLC